IYYYRSKVFLNAKLMADPHRNIERDIDRCDDIFHQYGDDMDEEQDPTVDFDNLSMNIGKDNDNDDNNTDVFEIQQLND
ncbi:unnamed protein product, partial [Rotaria sp. Silwood2]